MNAVTASVACDPRTKDPTIPDRVAEVVMKATARDPADRFATARALGAALGELLVELGAAGKERDVTASLAALLDPAPAPPRAVRVEEAVPETIAEVVPRDFESEIALVEAEMLEASGPIRIGPPPLPRVAAPPATTTMIPVRRKTLPQGIPRRDLGRRGRGGAGVADGPGRSAGRPPALAAAAGRGALRSRPRAARRGTPR